MKRQSVEHGIQNFLIAYARGIGVSCFRRNVGAMKTMTGGFIRFAQAGQSDLYGWDARGRHFELEIKAPKGRISEAQAQWLDYCGKHGCHTGVVNNTEDGVRFFELMKSTYCYQDNTRIWWWGMVNELHVECDTGNIGAHKE